MRSESWVPRQTRRRSLHNLGYSEPKWAEWALCYDTETTLDPKVQALLFGWYRVLPLEDGMYVSVEEGIFHADDLSEADIHVIKSYVRSHNSEVAHDDYDEHIKVYTRSEWVEKVFFEAVKNRALICAFNAPWDTSRLAVEYKPSKNRAWSFVLSQRAFNVEKLRKEWLTKKWATKRGNLRIKAGDYTVTITHSEGGYKADVYTPGKDHLTGKWNTSIDEAKLDGYRILSEHVNAMKKLGPILEANPERPRVIVTAKDSKAAFFSLTKPLRPEEWPCYEITRLGDEKLRLCHCGESATHRTADNVLLCAKHAKQIKERGEKVVPIKKLKLIFRVLDIRTLAWALFNESHSLKSACEALNTVNQKQDHEPTGQVTHEELDYGRQDVRCTVDVLNRLKIELDLHPIDLHPDKAVSPASIGKAYLRAMGIVPPMEKFDVPDYIHGIAAQSFSAGRSEIRIRHTPVPVCHTDLTSQYPSVQSLLGLPEVLTAERLSFDDVTDEIRALVENITLEDCFNRKLWRKFKVFVRVKPDGDLFPVRAEFTNDGVTKNIGMEFLTSEQSIWTTVMDVIKAKLNNNGKVPLIEKAIRMVPYGQQKGLKPVMLRGEIEVNPKDDLFQVMIEQKELYKKSAKEKKLRGDIAGAESDKALSYFLKICANATSYGMYFELTPQKLFNPVQV